MHRSAFRRVALGVTLAALCSCDRLSPSASGSSSAGTSAPAPDALCEHGVLAVACPKCNAKLEAVYRARGDWCEEHGFAESFCPICHPELGGRPDPDAAKTEHAKKERSASTAAAPADGTKVRLRTRAILEGIGLATAKATPATDGATLKVPARLAYDASRSAEINARSPGVVRSLLVDLGAPVKKGAQLATIESAGIGADRARLGAAQKRAVVAEQHLARITELERQGAASRRERLDAERDLSDAQGEAGALASELHAMGAAAGGGSVYGLTSPIDGVVARRTASIGTLVDTDTVLFHIVDARSLWAELDVPEADLEKIAIGAEIVVSFAALPADTFAARIASIAPEIDPHTRTAVARAALDNAGGKLRANMFGEAAVLGPAAPEAVVVPGEAVQTVGGQSLVFVRSGDLLFAVRHVTVAQRRGAQTVVREGLKAGEEIVTTGAFLLKTETLKDSIGGGCCAAD